MPVEVPCWWYLSGQCRHLGDGYSERCRFMHEPYNLMLALTAPSASFHEDDMPLCIPSCDRYRLKWNEGFGCSSQFQWWMFPTPAQCPCREARSAIKSDEDEMSDDDVIFIKQEEYNDGVQQRQQLRQQQQHEVPLVDDKAVLDAKEEKEEAEDEEEGDEESELEADEEWTAILPVPLHYLCLRALTTPAFSLFLRSAMGQTERDNGVHVIMHQQPCDARKPLMWGHVILYGTKEEVEKGKRALCAIMDSGYQHKADGRLLVMVTHYMREEEARRALVAEAGSQSMGDAMYEQSDEDQDDDVNEWHDPPLRRAADDDEKDYDDGDDEEWTTEDEAEYGVPNPLGDYTPVVYRD